MGSLAAPLWAAQGSRNARLCANRSSCPHGLGGGCRSEHGGDPRALPAGAPPGRASVWSFQSRPLEYTARDLFLDRTCFDASRDALEAVVRASTKASPLALVGLPLRTPGRVQRRRGRAGRTRAGGGDEELPADVPRVRGAALVSSGTEVVDGSTLTLSAAEVPFGTDVLLVADAVSDFVVGVEICETCGCSTHRAPRWPRPALRDLKLPPRTSWSAGRATKAACASASDRGSASTATSRRGQAVVDDLAFDAHAFVYENGHCSPSRRASAANRSCCSPTSTSTSSATSAMSPTPSATARARIRGRFAG